MKNLLNINCLIVSILFSSAQVHAQFFRGGWSIEARYAFTEHDIRWFGVPPRDAYTQYLHRNDPRTHNGKGTHDYALMVNKNILSTKYYALVAGLGLGYEMQTYFRPYDHSFRLPEGADITYEFRFSNDYRIGKLMTQINNRLQLGSFSLNNIIYPEFALYKYVNYRESHGFNDDWRFEFYAIDFSQSLGCKIGFIEPYVGYRWTQWKVKDDVYIYNKKRSTDYSYTHEWLQLRKLFAGVRIHLGSSQKKS